MAGIGIVSNPHSRRNRRYPEQMHRMAYVLGKEDVYKLTRSVEDIDVVAERFRDADIDILALNGGDGTNHMTLTSFIKVYGDKPLPMLALLRGGTMNTVSSSIGIRGRPNSLMVNIVEKYYLKQPFEISERDLLKITNDTGVSYGFLFGTGLVAYFLREYYDTGRPSPTTAVRLLARGIGSIAVRGPLIRRVFRTSRARISIDGEPWIEDDFATILGSTVEQIGFGFRPFIHCEAQTGAFHAVAIRGQPASVVRRLLDIRLGRPLPQEIFPDRVARKMIIKADEPIDYMIDGDLHSCGPELSAETGPRVKIIVK